MDISVSDAPVGRLLDGRYRIEALLARGGMATVYKALDTRLDRAVALKIMHAELAADDDFVARFIGEARAVAQLSEPNVVNVFDQGEDDGAVYLAMEYIEGRTLRDVLHERGRLGAALALEVAESVLTALAAAHRAGIVHRDVKPENVLVGNDGRVKVADFGLARAVSSSSKTTRGLLGTVTYISPEQALGEKATPRSDVYSSGIMLFELLTGRTPHDGPTDFVVVRSHIDNDVPPPSESVPLPPPVDDLVLTATSRVPADRYADASEFLTAVRAVRARLSGQDGPDVVDDDLADQHAEPRDSAGVTLEEALAAPAEEPTDDGDDDGDDADGRTEDDESTEVVAAHTPRSGHPAGLPPPPPPPTRTRVIETDSGPAGHVPAGDDGADARDQQRTRPRFLLFALVLLLVVGVAAGAWWYGAGRWTSTPSLLNLTAEQAQEAATAEGLTATAGDEVFSETVKAGLVVSTEPGPGERILKGDEIIYTVSKGPERYEIPSLAGMTVEQARDALAGTTIDVRVTDETYHETVPKGQVVSQNVKPGERVRRGTELGVVISLGRQPITIDDYTGQPADKAADALTAAGFNVSTSEEFSDDVDPGRVISQQPREGTGFKGDEITLVVSLGSEMVKVPQVVNSKVKDAERKLRDAGFEVEVVDLLPDLPSGEQESRVVRIEPSGEQPRGTTITIYHF